MTFYLVGIFFNRQSNIGPEKCLQLVQVICISDQWVCGSTHVYKRDRDTEQKVKAISHFVVTI